MAPITGYSMAKERAKDKFEMNANVRRAYWVWVTSIPKHWPPIQFGSRILCV